MTTRRARGLRRRSAPDAVSADPVLKAQIMAALLPAGVTDPDHPVLSTAGELAELAAIAVRVGQVTAPRRRRAERLYAAWCYLTSATLAWTAAAAVGHWLLGWLAGMLAALACLAVGAALR